jgi:hypothetical protein
MQATPKVTVATVPFHSAATLAHIDYLPQRFFFELVGLNEGVVGEIKEAQEDAREAERRHESQEVSEARDAKDFEAKRRKGDYFRKGGQGFRLTERRKGRGGIQVTRHSVTITQ